MAPPKLHRTYMAILAAFYESGGSGTLDLHGRVCVGPTRAPLHGELTAWLVLVSHGYVAGERGIIMLTEEGREAAAAELGARARIGP